MDRRALLRRFREEAPTSRATRAARAASPASLALDESVEAAAAAT